jgi:hypothetical protein
VVRSIIKFLNVAGSEAGGNAGRDHLEEHRRPIMVPQRQRAEQKGGGGTRTSHDDHRRNPA